MTIKALMVDVDGVLVIPPDGNGWSTNLHRDLGIETAALQESFFKPHWDDVVHGRASLRDRLAPALSEFAPKVSCDDLIDYWFTNDAHLNDALLAELASFRADGIEVHLATVQEHERARYLWDELDLRSSFDGMHYATALGFSKPDPRFYGAIEMRTGLRPCELFLIDDRMANVEGAIMAGWGGVLWTGQDELRALIPR